MIYGLKHIFKDSSFGVSHQSDVLLLVVLAYESGRTVPKDYTQLLLSIWPELSHMLIPKSTLRRKKNIGTICRLGSLNHDTIDLLTDNSFF